MVFFKKIILFILIFLFFIFSIQNYSKTITINIFFFQVKDVLFILALVAFFFSGVIISGLYTLIDIFSDDKNTR